MCTCVHRDMVKMCAHTQTHMYASLCSLINPILLLRTGHDDTQFFSPIVHGTQFFSPNAHGRESLETAWNIGDVKKNKKTLTLS